MNDLNGLMEQAPDLIVTYGIKLIFAIIIFIVGKYFSNLARKITIKLLKNRKIDETVVSFVGNIAWALVFTLTIIATLGQIGVQTASLVAVVGAAGLAVGLALQGSLANFAAGVLMVLFKPCRVGNYIEAAGVAGTVNEITIFSTRLLTPDNKVIVVPNAAIMGGSITNYSAMDTRRVDLVIGVSYDADLKQAKQLLCDILENNQYVLKDPKYTVAVSALADSSVNFVVRPWVKTGDYWGAYFELTETIKLALDEAGIGIPYPQMDVYVKETPAA